MRHSSTSIATHSRRRFITGATAVIVAGTDTHAKADFRYRLGLSQPLDSPNYLRLQEMAEKVRLETNDRMLIEVHGAGKLGSDSAMLALLQKNELEMYLGGNVFGPLVPITEMSGLPFIFKNSADVFAALDGEFGDDPRLGRSSVGAAAFSRRSMRARRSSPSLWPKGHITLRPWAGDRRVVRARGSHHKPPLPMRPERRLRRADEDRARSGFACRNRARSYTLPPAA
jgi:hypothetical protein